jgi:hypothetical protein
MLMLEATMAGIKRKEHRGFFCIMDMLHFEVWRWGAF